MRLLSALLAAKRSGDRENPRRVFNKLPTPKGEDNNLVYIAAPLARWNWAFLEARDCLGLSEVAVSAIIPSHWMAVKRTSTYVRNYTVDRRRMEEKFESVQSGNVFSMQFVLSKHIPPDTDGGGRFTRTPEVEELDSMLELIGERLGMSEWGQGYLFGRFELSLDQPTPPTGAAEPAATG